MFPIVLMRSTLLSVGFSVALLAAQAFKPLPTIEVTAPKDITSVEALSGTLDAVSEKVTACIKGGGKAETCQCRYPQELSLLRKRYESLVEQHPDWKDQMLSYQYVNKEGRNVSGTLVLQNLRRQLEALKCQ